MEKISLLKKIYKSFWLLLYYGIAQYLPNSYSPIPYIGKISNAIRVFLCKRIFLKCGEIRTINRRVYFDTGFHIQMGDGSGIGEHTILPPDIIIGKNVMFGRYSFVLARNHYFDRIDIPLVEQGVGPSKQTIIDDDCWIGLHTLMTPGRHVSKGTIIGMGTVLTKDFPAYSVVGGAPSKLIRSRLQDGINTDKG